MSFQNAGHRETLKFILDYAKGKPVEATQAVLKARTENTYINERDLQIDDGKKREFRITYYPPICDAEGTGEENICDSGTVIQPKQVQFALSKVTASKVWELKADDVRLVDDAYTFSDHARSIMMAALPQVRTAMNNDITALLYANKGVLPNGQTDEILPMINNANGEANPMGLFRIEKAYRDSGYSERPYIVGGNDVFMWKKATNIGGLNAGGQRIDQMTYNELYYDDSINTAAADASVQHIISFDPQMIKFVSFNRNAGLFATDEMSLEATDMLFKKGYDGMVRGVMMDPVTGLLWDMNLDFDKCLNNGTGGWKFQIKLEWDIFIMPESVCNVAGVNSIYHWKTCQPQNTVCDPNNSPISGVATKTFEFDTNGELTYPLIVNKLNVAGSTSYPDTTNADLDAFIVTLNDAAPAGYTFTKSGTKIQYTGYSAITVVLNTNTDLAFTEA